MKNKRQNIFISLFLLGTILLYPVYFLVYKNLDNTNHENRNYTTISDIKNASIKQKPAIIENFINDNAPFKNQLTSLNAWINLKLFNTIISDEVLLGKEEWLFYKNVHDSESIDDYQGLNHYSEDKINNLCEKLNILQEVLDEKDIQFKLMIVPNKERVYSRYMPDNIPVVDTPRIEILVNAIQNSTDVKFAYPLNEFTQASYINRIYYKYDTHWNNAGALLGAQILMEDFYDSTSKSAEGTPLMDLANISSIYNYLEKDEFFEVVNNEQFTDENLYILHDSFGDALKPILSNKYNVSGASFAYFNTFDIPKDTDVLVIEVSERFVYRLFDTVDRIIENAQKI